MNASEADRRIRSLRPAKPFVDPYRAHGALVENERRPNGAVERALTVFLAGAECAFTCAFCDLWRWTLDVPTPPGALATQLRAMPQLTAVPLPDRIKLYNASNFFDPRCVPLADLPEIAALTAPFAGVTVESHASTIGARTLAFAGQIEGRLEVAIGLETVHPVAAAQMNKRLDFARFDRAAHFLGENGIDLRVFVLLGVPHVPAAESIDWTVRTVEYAVARGASLVSIIPVRGGNGEMERLHALGEFTPPLLSELEEALDRCVQLTGAAITADLWDAERLPGCEQCRAARIERLGRVNLGGRGEPRVACNACDSA